MRALLPWLSALALTVGVASAASARSPLERDPACVLEHAEVLLSINGEYEAWLAQEEAQWRSLYQQLRASGADAQTLAIIEAEGRAALRAIRAESRDAVNAYLASVCGGGEPCDPDQEQCEPEPCGPDGEDCEPGCDPQTGEGCEPEPCDPAQQDCEPEPCDPDQQDCEPGCDPQTGEGCEPEPCDPAQQDCEPEPCDPDQQDCEPVCDPQTGEGCEPEPPCGYNGEYCWVECNDEGRCRVCSELTGACEICDPNQDDCWL
jgi:hypothetical protein